MAKTPLLNRRPSGIYHVRLSVPKSLRHAVGQSEIHRSTGCRELHLAKIVAGQLLSDWRRLLQHYSKMDIRKLAAGSLSIVGDGYLRLPDAAAELGCTPRELYDSMIAAGRMRVFVQAANWMGWLTTDIHEIVSLDRDAYSGDVLSRDIDYPKLELQGPQQPFTGRLRIAYLDDVVPLVDGAESVSVVVLTLPTTHDGGLVSDFPGNKITLDMLEVLREDMSHVASRLMVRVAAATSAKTNVDAAARSTRSDIPFSKLVEEFFEANSTAWERQDHKDRLRKIATYFQQLMGDMPIADIDRDTARAFARIIKDIPANRDRVQKKFNAPDSIELLMSLKRQHLIDGISDAEQAKMLAFLSRVFEWGCVEQRLEKNPFKTLSGEAKKQNRKSKLLSYEKPTQQRDVLSRDDLAKIFKLSWFQTGKGQKTHKGLYHKYRPHYYWLPLLGLYVGGRVNELSQLYLKDIKFKDGIPIIDFNLIGDTKTNTDDKQEASSDKSLKTINAIREIPIHQKLIDLGFFQYVEKLKEEGFERLFPELKLSKSKDQGYGKAVSAWFNEKLLGRNLKITRDGKRTFHSLRHNFATALGVATTDLNERADLMGHSRVGAETEVRYNKGSLQSKKLAIDRVVHDLPEVHPFDVTEGLIAVRHALEYKRHQRPAVR